jgi:hypothetical protein
MFEEQLHWLQCTLAINIYLEKFYIIIWFWLWFVLLSTVLSIFNYILRFTMKRRFFIQSRLESNNEMDREKCVDIFLRETNLDTLLVLKIIHSNTSEFYASAIINELKGLIMQSYQENALPD